MPASETMTAHYPHRAFIGIGSNLADPLIQVTQGIMAIDALPLCEVSAISPLYRTRPVGPQDQDDFINGVIELQTAYTPLALLDQLQRLEQRQRRVRVRHWGPRTLDLDLLLFDDRIITHPRLQVPHREFLNRPFAWKPVLDIVPQLALPDNSLLRDRVVMDHCNDMVQIAAPALPMDNTKP